MKGKSESEVSQSCQTLATPWTTAYQAPPSMGFSRQKYWSGVPLPSPKTSISRVENLGYVTSLMFGFHLSEKYLLGCISACDSLLKHNENVLFFKQIVMHNEK